MISLRRVRTYAIAAAAAFSTTTSFAEPEGTWTPIANEWSNFTVSGTQRVRFGAGQLWVQRNASGSNPCTNTFFGGDPAPGTVKLCDVLKPAVPAPSFPTIAPEWQTFSVSGTQQVRFGAGDRWLQRPVTTSGDCRSTFFGFDPAVGVAKVCQLIAATSPGWSVQEPFASTSYWKQTIPTGATYGSSTDPRNVSFQQLATKLSVNVDRYTLWVWRATNTDPVVTFRVSAAFVGDAAHAREGYVSLRLPASAHPDPGDNNAPGGYRAGWGPCAEVRDSDRAMVVIDPDGRTAHEFWQACRVDGTSGEYQATSYAKVDISLDGLNISGPITQQITGNWNNPAYLTYGWGAVRAYGGSALPGLIRAGETTSGMRHRIALQLPKEILYFNVNDQPSSAIWEPATKADSAGDMGGLHTIKHGQLFAIPRSVNVSQLGLATAAARTLAKALQDYGAVVMDQSSVPTLVSDGVAAQADGFALRNAPADMAIIHANLRPVN